MSENILFSSLPPWMMKVFLNFTTEWSVLGENLGPVGFKLILLLIDSEFLPLVLRYAILADIVKVLASLSCVASNYVY